MKNTYPTDLELALIAENHVKGDLQDSDREALRSARNTHDIHRTIGTYLGLGLGLFSAFRYRRSRMQKYTAFQTREKPIFVVFADGRREAAADFSPVMTKPSTFGHIATYIFFGLGFTAIGRVTGIITGSLSGSKLVNQDPESRERIQTALQKLKADGLRMGADGLRKQADALLKEQDVGKEQEADREQDIDKEQNFDKEKDVHKEQEAA